MIPIIKWELGQRKGYIMWWCIGCVALIGLLLLIYPSIHDQATVLNKVLNQLPAGLRELKTGGAAADISSPIGYLNAQVYYVTLPLLFSIMTIGLGSSLLARDEQNHTLELLLARPVSRGKLLAAKVIAGLLIVAIVSSVTTIATLLLAKAVSLDVDTAYLLLINLYTTLFALSFGFIGLVLSSASTLTSRFSRAAAVLVAFGGYLLASLSGLTHWLQTPAKFAPYHYFDPTQILHGHLSKGLDAYLLFVFVGGALLAWIGFRRRDIN